MIARRMVEGKIRNSRTLLRRNSRGDVANEVESMGRLAGQAARASGFPTLLGLEGGRPDLLLQFHPDADT